MTGACIILYGFLIPNVINYNNQITVTSGWSRNVTEKQACETTALQNLSLVLLKHEKGAGKCDCPYVLNYLQSLK